MPVTQIGAGNSRVPLHKRLTLRMSDRQLGVFGAVGAVLGIAGIFVAVWASVFAVQDEKQIIYIVFGTSLVYAISVVFVVWLLISETLSIEKDLIATQGERESLRAEKVKLEGECAALELKYETIDNDIQYTSNIFEEMSRAISAFDYSVDCFVQRACSASSEDKKEELLSSEWDGIHKRWQLALASLCDTAATVIPLKKGLNPRGGLCSANIKVIRRSADSSSINVYQVVQRSSMSPSARYQDDEQNGRPVMRNMMYHEMLAKKDIHIVSNMDEYIKLVARLDSYDEPAEMQARFYKSCLIVPIREATASFIPSGIFCIDSHQPDFFNDKYDKSIMTQLAGHAQMCFRLFYRADKARNIIKGTGDTTAIF